MTATCRRCSSSARRSRRRRRTIEIGTGVVLAPMYHPLRLAEDAATVQLLEPRPARARPRARLVGDRVRRASVPTRAVAVRRWTRSSRSCRRRGAASRSRTRAPSTDLPTLGVRPRPSTPIPVLIGGGAELAIRRAARLADGLFANAPAAKFVEQVRWVLDECEQIGRDPCDLPVHPLLGAAARRLARGGARPLPRRAVGDAVEVLRHGGLGDPAAAAAIAAAVRSPRR